MMEISAKKTPLPLSFDREKVAENVINYYSQLGHGDLKAGIKLARKTVINRLIESILTNDRADSELKEKAFYTRATLDFLDNYAALQHE